MRKRMEVGHQMSREEQDKHFFESVDRQLELVKVKLRQKRHDYGRDNILRHGAYGVLVRKDDKMSRVVNLLKPGVEPHVKDESLTDTFRDDIGYSLIALALLEGAW